MLFWTKQENSRCTTTCLPSHETLLRKVSKICWKSKDETISDIHRCSKNFLQLWVDPGCRIEDLSCAMADGYKSFERVKRIRVFPLMKINESNLCIKYSRRSWNVFLAKPNEMCISRWRWWSLTKQRKKIMLLNENFLGRLSSVVILELLNSLLVDSQLVLLRPGSILFFASQIHLFYWSLCFVRLAVPSSLLTALFSWLGWITNRKFSFLVGSHNFIHLNVLQLHKRLVEKAHNRPVGHWRI